MNGPTEYLNAEEYCIALLARGLRGFSGIHLLRGIFGYLGSPLWLAFLITFSWALWYRKHTDLSLITVRAFTPFLSLNRTEHAFLIFMTCIARPGYVTAKPPPLGGSPPSANPPAELYVERVSPNPL